MIPPPRNALPGNITAVVYSWLDRGRYPVLQATGLLTAGAELITNVRFLDLGQVL
ncbi:MAG: hypothetical protein R3C61_04150 [Bacteroidia bacterium]